MTLNGMGLFINKVLARDSDSQVRIVGEWRNSDSRLRVYPGNGPVVDPGKTATSWSNKVMIRKKHWLVAT